MAPDEVQKNENPNRKKRIIPKWELHLFGVGIIPFLATQFVS